MAERNAKGQFVSSAGRARDKGGRFTGAEDVYTRQHEGGRNAYTDIYPANGVYTPRITLTERIARHWRRFLKALSR